MIYCDASVIVASLVDEPHSVAVDRWLRSTSAADVFASQWTVTEVASALAFKLRLGHIDSRRHGVALTDADKFFASMRVVPVEPRHFLAAGKRHVLTPPGGLRAGDALHFAVVHETGSALATLDRRFAEAARHAGTIVETILPD